MSVLTLYRTLIGNTWKLKILRLHVTRIFFFILILQIKVSREFPYMAIYGKVFPKKWICMRNTYKINKGIFI